MRILAIDPGPAKSGIVILNENYDILYSKVSNNESLQNLLCRRFDVVVIERVVPQQMTGHSIIDTAILCGYFSGLVSRYSTVKLYPRKDILNHFGLNKKQLNENGKKIGNDSKVRTYLLNRFGDKTKGVTSHAWQALAAGVMCIDLKDFK